jgi:small GTP-binding protein
MLPTFLILRDTAGQERFHTITKAYYRGAHGIILVYDLTSEESYLNVEKWVQGIREEGPSHVLLQLVGNKLDLAQSWRSVDTEKARMAAKRQQMSFYETSAKSGENVQDAFHNFVVELKDFYDRSMVALSTSDVEGEVIRLQTTSSARHCPC